MSLLLVETATEEERNFSGVLDLIVKPYLPYGERIYKVRQRIDGIS